MLVPMPGLCDQILFHMFGMSRASARKSTYIRMYTYIYLYIYININTHGRFSPSSPP